MVDAVATGSNLEEPMVRVPRYEVSNTVSPEAREALPSIFAIVASAPHRKTAPATSAEWSEHTETMEAFTRPYMMAEASKLPVRWQSEAFGKTPVLRITPIEAVRSGRLLIYAHGGGYTNLSAQSGILLPALVAAASGCEVISVDYTLAPHSDWRSIPDEVIDVYRQQLESGYQAQHIGMFGDSAGGGLVAGATLKMRDDGMPVPGALYLISPWADVKGSGDTRTTLAAADPLLNADILTWCADAYARPDDQAHPYVSPVYGDFAKPFPPTLIQGGTREFMVSDCVRLYQAIAQGPNRAVLDLYEGMPHVWQVLVPWVPETNISIERAVAFFDQHLAATF